MIGEIIYNDEDIKLLDDIYDWLMSEAMESQGSEPYGYAKKLEEFIKRMKLE